MSLKARTLFINKEFETLKTLFIKFSNKAKQYAKARDWNNCVRCAMMAHGFYSFIDNVPPIPYHDIDEDDLDKWKKMILAQHKWILNNEPPPAKWDGSDLEDRTRLILWEKRYGVSTNQRAGFSLAVSGHRDAGGLSPLGWKISMKLATDQSRLDKYAALSASKLQKHCHDAGIKALKLCSSEEWDRCIVMLATWSTIIHHAARKLGFSVSEARWVLYPANRLVADQLGYVDNG